MRVLENVRFEYVDWRVCAGVDCDYFRLPAVDYVPAPVGRSAEPDVRVHDFGQWRGQTPGGRLSAAPYRGHCVGVAAGTRDLIAVVNMRQGPRCYGGMFPFRGAQNWEGKANRSDQGGNILDYTQSSPLIARGNDGEAIMACSGANTFQVVTWRSGATGYSGVAPTTAGGGIQMEGPGTGSRSRARSTCQLGR